MTIPELIRHFFAGAEARVNGSGNTVLTAFAEGDRYAFDFRHCRDWQQYDTDQDAAYFGVWVKPNAALTFAEGDLTLELCEDEGAYNAMLTRMGEFYAAGKIAVIINASGRTVLRQDREKFKI